VAWVLHILLNVYKGVDDERVFKSARTFGDGRKSL
jgi:hypothetical protein